MDDLIERTLQRRAQAAELPDVAADAIRRRAARVRGRRRGALVSVLAAAAVLGVVIAGLRLRPDPPPAPTSGRVVTVDSLAGIPRGAPPRIGYLRGDTFVRADGTTRAVPAGIDVGSWLPLGRGTLVVDATTYELLRLNAAGRVIEREADGSIAVSSDGSRIARFGTGHLVVTDAAGHVVTLEKVARAASVDGFLSGGRLLLGGERRARVWDAGRTTPLTDVLSAAASNDATDLVSGKTPTGFGVVDASSGREQWQADQVLGAFSPDGRYVVGTPAGGNQRSVSVLDARTAARVRTLRLTHGLQVAGAVWEDDTHLLVTAEAGQQRTLLRFGVDGRVARTIALEPGDLVPQRRP